MERNYLSFQNGILDLSAFLRGEANCLLPHTPLWFSTVAIPYDFNPQADCLKWRAFLNRNLQGKRSDKAKLLQQFAGYCLWPHLEYHKYLQLVGDGANGKSVFCAAMEAMLGETNISSVPLELFGDRFRLRGTIGKLANISAEVGELDKVAEGILKSFVSGDAMEFEQKFKSPFMARPTAKLIFSSNNIPSFSDKTDGLWRRMLLVRMNVQIPEAERITGMDTPGYWKEEAPGICNWALAGLAELKAENRFIVPADVKVDIDKARTDSNPARQYLDDHFEEGPDDIACQWMYSEYAQWAKDSGYHPLADRGFGREVSRRFPKIERKQQTVQGEGRLWHYVGITRKS